MTVPLGIFKAFRKNKKGGTKVNRTTVTNNYAAPTAAAAATPAIGSEEERRKKLQQAYVLGTSGASTQEGGLV